MEAASARNSPSTVDRDLAELERRIDQLERLDDSAAGRFTSWDWAICVLGSVIIPCLVLWWAAP